MVDSGPAIEFLFKRDVDTGTLPSAEDIYPSGLLPESYDSNTGTTTYYNYNVSIFEATPSTIAVTAALLPMDIDEAGHIVIRNGTYKFKVTVDLVTENGMRIPQSEMYTIIINYTQDELDNFNSNI
jgi:hypothetical protein